MGEMVGSKRAAGDTTPQESPLVPNRKMQRMYQGIIESRMLEELLRKRYKKAKLGSSYGQEACRNAALIDLEPGDLVSDLPESLTAAFLLGAEPGTIIENIVQKKSATSKSSFPASLLPPIGDTAERLHVALGAALTLKRLSPSRILVVFVEAGEVKPSTLKHTLHFAAQQELPMLFVVLPQPTSKVTSKVVRKALSPSARSTSLGVAGIPVDASDAVALYRVVQESIGRARSGGGPALMECTHLLLEGKKKSLVSDPAAAMGRTLLDRQICNQGWLDSVRSGFQVVLKAL
ncbi:thiamine pyrophosphate-dependent enzyme [Granulicella arctica]|uniref:thiamine pyrophosphate-dependent enzyme n=1 Tax=Granulicella arctica TaxID=940613 RepID=UPI0021E04CA2|nr:thiamine pyrophosphate-dependent enzyme [Granulicella arctica]